MNFWGHLKTVTKHRTLVLVHCVKLGIVWQGLTHDLSKYSPTEFLAGIRYYQGTRSPNVAEREDKGFSSAWIHHKGRNRHHMEYWTDLKLGTREYVPVAMPRKYVAEMVADRMAACKTYRGKDYGDGDALAYLEYSKESLLMHPQTVQELTTILTVLKDQGEKAMFAYVKQYRKGKL